MNEQMNGLPENREHYPYVTRSLLRLHEEGGLRNVASIDVEPDYGYIARLNYQDGSHRITYGNDLGLNIGAACDLAKDKGHTKFMLKQIDINHPKGSTFLLPWWTEKIMPTQVARGNTSIRTSDQAFGYVETELGYPVYTKPVDGSKGGDIYKVHSPEELEETIALYDEKKIRVAIVEEPILMPDYRIVSLDGELISAYERVPLTVVGDGKSTIEGLLSGLQEQFEAEGRDTRLDSEDPHIAKHLDKNGLSIADVPEVDQSIVLLPVSNLSMGGTSREVSGEIHERWAKLAAFIGQNFNLRLCGVDLACTDITNPESDYSVIEVNATPGLDHYAASGDVQRVVVDQLYIRVFDALPRY